MGYIVLLIGFIIWSLIAVWLLYLEEEKGINYKLIWYIIPIGLPVVLFTSILLEKYYKINLINITIFTSIIIELILDGVRKVRYKIGKNSITK